MIIINNEFEIISLEQLNVLKKLHKKNKEDIGIKVKEEYLSLYYDLFKQDKYLKLVVDISNGLLINEPNLELTFESFRFFPSCIRKNILHDDVYLIMMLKKVLKESRYLHSLSVALVCAYLAKCHHLDEEEAYMAGILHDCCKYLSDEETDNYLKYYDSDKLAYPSGTKHSFVAKYFLKEKLKFHNNRILNAIYNHTICNSNDKLSKILFIADKREPLRNLGNDIIELAKTDLDLAYKILNEDVEEYLRGKNERIIKTSI